MARAKIRWRYGAFRDLRTLPAVMAELERRGRAVADAAGDGYEASPARVTGGWGRGRVTVKTATTSARRREAKDHNLLRALGAGRG